MPKFSTLPCSVSPQTEQKHWGNVAVSEKDLHNNNSVEHKARRKALPKYLISDEIRALFAVITKPRDEAIFRLAYHHGLRASEIGLIQMQDYHPGTRASNDCLIIERLKGSIGGNTILVKTAAIAVRKWVKKRGQRPGPMFRTQMDTAISRWSLDQLMKHYCALAGIPREKAHFHALKHSCGTMLLSEWKLPLVQVKNHLGHRNIQSTMIYADLTEQANEERAVLLRNWK